MSYTAADGLFASTCAVLLGLILFWDHPFLQLTYDSYDYISASKNAHTYLTGKNADGFPFLIRAPLLPFYLHFFANPLLAGALLNCISLAISIFLCLRLGRLYGLDPTGVYFFPLSVMFNYSFLQDHLFLWTEPAFTAIIITIFYCLVTDKPIYQVIFLLIVASLLRKAAGFATVATVVSYLSQRKIRESIIIAGAVALAVIAWECFTIYQAGVSLSRETFLHHVTLSRMPYLDSLTSWIFPRVLPSVFRVVLLAACIALIFSNAVSAPLMEYFKETGHQYLFIFWLVYASGQFIFWGATDFHDADRFLSVILPFFMLTAFSLLSYIFRSDRDRRRVHLLVVIWLVYPVSKTLWYLIFLAD